MKIFVCKLCGEHESMEPKCNKCMTLCPLCKGDTWNKGTVDCAACFGAGAAMPNTHTEFEMLSYAKMEAEANGER